MLVALSPLSFQIFQTISNHNGRAFIVGGAIRDALMGKENHDIDVEVYGLTYQELYNVLSQFGHVLEMGKSFGIMKLDLLPEVDFALPRLERKTGNKHQDFDVVIDPYLDYVEASHRRDLTINSFLYDPLKDELIDPNHGKDDLENHLIRCIDPMTFKEDPLRVLRVASFVSRLGFEVEEETLNTCKDMVKMKMLDSLSQERINEEYNKLLLGKHPHLGLEFLEKIDALPSILKDLITTPQRLDYHPEGCVFNHVKLVVKEGSKVKHEASDPLGFMWACLLHDVGKAKTTSKDLHAPYHGKVGREIAQSFVKRYILSKQRQNYVLEMIEVHMALMNMMLHSVNVKRYYYLLKKIDGILELNDLILISKCDKIGRGKPDLSISQRFDHFMEEMIKNYGSKKMEPLVNGKDLILEGIHPSSDFKSYLDKAYDYQMDGLNKEEIIYRIKEDVHGKR